MTIRRLTPLVSRSLCYLRCRWRRIDLSLLRVTSRVATPPTLFGGKKPHVGVDMSENGQAMGAIEEVGPGGHYLGCEHTQANFKTAFWRSDLFDYKPFETWDEEGARDTQTLATARVAKLLETYQQPALDPEIEARLRAYVAEKKASMPDAFM